MVDVAAKYQSDLKRIKANIQDSYEYFRDNNESYHLWKKFVFVTALTDEDKALLSSINKPQIEQNILEAYISRLRGEFSKQEPSFSARAGDPDLPVHPDMIDFVEAKLRYILSEANQDGFEYDTYSDTLGGGFSVMKFYPKYAKGITFKQKMCVEKLFDPTMCGFDRSARKSHKGDGKFCFELFPKTEEDFKSENPKVDISKLKFTRNIGSFNWSYQTNTQKVILVCDYYEKKGKRVRIVELASGQCMTKDDYKEMLERWNMMGFLAQPPQILQERWEIIDTICRYRLIEDQVIEYVETDYTILPLIFVDGNSVMLRDGLDSEMRQITRPYVYQAKGLQRLKNFSIQTLANELENMVQHKWIAPKEGIPANQQDAYTNPQLYSTLIYNAYMDEQVDKPLPPPQPVPRIAAPPEVMGTVQATDVMAQTTLGSYDAALGINDNQLSGIAIVEAATQSNATAMPYLVSYMQALTQVAIGMVGMFPKIWTKKTTLPVMSTEGQEGYAVVNQPGSTLQLDYGRDTINVMVKAGPNFAIQQARSFDQMVKLMQVSPLVQEFIGSTQGLPLLLDNLDMKGVEKFKEEAKKFIAQKQQQMAMQQQMQMQQMQMAAQQPNPLMIEAQRIQIDQERLAQNQQKMELEHAKDIVELHQNQASIQNDRDRIALQAAHLQEQKVIQKDKAKSEHTNKMIDKALSHIDMNHKHSMAKAKHEHMVNQSNKSQGENTHA